MPLERAPMRGPHATDRRPAPAMARAAAAPSAVSRHPIARSVAPSSPSVAGVVQRFANVSSPNDRAEVEAVHVAHTVMRMNAPSSPVSVGARSATATHRAPLSNAAAPRIGSTNAAAVGGAGNLPAGVRSFMEPRLGADFSAVRVHTDAAAAQRSTSIDAQAYTTGKDIHFAKGRYQPDTPAGKELIAHELTHTIQQGAVRQVAPSAPAVRERPATATHRSGGILDWFADKANYIPGFRMFCIVLGMNPINMAAVDRSAANVLRAVIEFIPGGKAIGDALAAHGIFDRIGTWVNQKLRELSMVGGAFKSAIDRFVSGISATDILWVPGWGDFWGSAKRIFTEPIDRIKAFVATLATEIVQFIREAILLPLAALAEGTRGYDLLKAVLGEDPVTGHPVPRNAETLIGGFMKLVGQEDVWENVKKSGAIPRAWAWFLSALAGLLGFVKQIPTLAVATFKSLEVTDMILVPRAFAKFASVFGNFIGQFINWAGNAAWTLLEIIFAVVSPSTLTYLKKTGAALKSILKNPLPFVRNLVNAAKLGLQNFADNFVGHLKAGLIDWLTGSLEGVYIPKALSLLELGKFAISVLGVSWAQIRAKMVKVLGPAGETIMKGLESGFDIVVALVKGGPAAAWELIKEKLTDLKDQVVSGIIGFVTDTVVKKAIPKLVAMFIPGAGFISAIISIYDTIMVFVEKMSKIVQVITAFVDSIVTIAGGNIAAAAKRVESVLGGLLSLSISFLAGFLGLGKVTDKIKEVIQKVRGTVDKAIDGAIAWVVDKAKKLFGNLFGKKGEKPDQRTDAQKDKDKLSAISDAEKLLPESNVDEVKLRGQLPAIKTKYKVLSLDLVVESKKDRQEAVHFEASASQVVSGKTKVITTAAGGGILLAPGAWIKVKSDYEQISSSTNVLKRTPSGQEAISFMSTTTGGALVSHAYSAEGKEWERTTFVHGSKYVMPIGNAGFALKPAYRGSGPIRPTFYADSASSRAAIVASKLPALLSPAHPKHFLSEAPANLEAAKGYKVDPASGKAVVPQADASPDHDPPVSEHWSSAKGNDVVQSTRVVWNSTASTYKLMSLTLNLSLGSRGATFTEKVGVNFRGPGE